MKMIQFLTFFSIVLAIYGTINYYIFIRGWQALAGLSSYRIYYLILFLVIALSFIAGRVLERFFVSIFSDVLVWIGSYWLAAMLYFFLIIIVLDLIRLFNHWLPLLPSAITSDYSKAKLLTFGVSIILVVVTITAGHFNALWPRVKTLELAIPKETDGPKSVNMVIASDIHLGTIIGRSRFDRLVQKINDLKPDIVLLPGDIVDEDLGPVIRENLGDALRSIKAPLGLYASTGNHEYIGGVEKACKYLTEHGVTMLRDTAVKVNGSFYLVGREDRSISGFAGKKRKPLDELMTLVDKSYPVVLMDHQPIGLTDASANGIDLQLSGHTHHGQLWPFNFITKAVYDISWGYREINGTRYYVSCGFGTWGPPVRTDCRPEIVNIKLKFE